ncbi:response regulator [Saccharospirillum mangrovi]|uniref:response regulator n=1 Tax=Saccharospirillum mangrovi TaxID=2161747 RepID=UPI000D357855|nr:response regulator [Saccharospirillum mangrovi]
MLQTLHFLVADDAGFIRDLVKRALRSQFTQCQIDEAVNGSKAQALLNKKRYDLVLCDWEMPEMSGLELLQWLRDREQLEGEDKTPFIMVTSRGDKDHVVKAVEAGVNDYIGKPFSNEQLLRKIFKALSVTHRDLIRAILKGRSVMAQSRSDNDSASLLTGANKPASDESAASLLTAGSPSGKLVAENAIKPPTPQNRKKLTLQVSLRSSTASWTGVVRDINLTEIAVQIAFDDTLPPVLHEQVVVDVQAPDQEGVVARVNGFVMSLALQEATQDCRRARVGVKFVDDDEDKMAVLSRLVGAFRNR